MGLTQKKQSKPPRPQTLWRLCPPQQMGLNGVMLDDFIPKRKPRDNDTIRFMAAELLCGLQFLHSRGIMHGDLRVNNIFIDNTEHVKIINFGLEKMREIPFCSDTSSINPEKAMYVQRNFRQHPFFAGINWDELEAENVRPPYVMEPVSEIMFVVVL